MDDTASSTLQVLRARASRYALYGSLIATLAVVLATVLVCLFVYDGVTLDNIIRAHRENMAIWTLDALPFLYAGWGQYASMSMAREARSMVQTRVRAMRDELEQVESSARARSDFFARISHELRTPINAIMGMSDLLLEPRLDQRQARRVQVIHDSAHELLTLINDVLDYSRIEAGRMELDEVEFNLHDSLHGAVTLLTTQAEGKGLRIVTRIPADAPKWVVGDPGRLRQIVINLLGNAIKFTDSGEVTLRVAEWKRETDDSLLLRLEITDTGAGIAEPDQAALFEPYRRGNGEHASAGTGLGLSISRELVTAMGGEIGVSSTPGDGSTFWFSVRLTETDALDISELTRRMDLQGIRMLLAEKDATSRDMLAGQLRALGIHVTTAVDGIEAMQLVLRSVEEGYRFDLVLADMFLPYLSGEELGRRLKERAETRDVVLAIMTTAGARGDARRLSELGFSGYLVRPIPPEDLRELVTTILALQALPQEQRARHGLVTRYSVREHRTASDRVLLVEDSAINREISVGALHDLGLEVDVARNGAEALAAAAAGEYGVILMDLQLPDLNGSRVIERIRAMDEPRGRVPTLVFTAGATEAEKRQCREAGADAFLIKPVRPDELRTTLARYVCLRQPVDIAATAGIAKAAKSDGSPLDDVMVTIFLREASQRMAQIRQALGDPVDFAAIARHAHALKGASRHFTNGGLPILAAALEDQAGCRDRDGVRQQIPELESAWVALREFLETVVPDSRSVRTQPPATTRANGLRSGH